MLNWLFKRRGSAAATPASTSKTAPAPATSSGRRAAAQAAAAAAARPPAPAAPVIDWAARLQAAQGDDAALLGMAQEKSSTLDVKLAAVQALAGEEALRQAERAFRSHDRKVHQLAKKRLESAAAQRVARASADTLLARTAALTAEELVAINHVVALDRAWQALPADLLEPAQRSRFAELRAALDAAMHARVDEQQRVQRWTADARRALTDARTSLISAADQGAADDVAAIRLALDALDATRPHLSATDQLAAELAQALHGVTLVEARLAWFDAADAAAAAVAAVTATPAAPVADVPAATTAPAAAVPSDAAQPPPEPAAGGDATSAELTTVAIEAHVQDAATVPDPSDTPAPEATDIAAEAEADIETNTSIDAAPTAPATPEAPRWRDLPALPDAALTQALEQRHARWLAQRQAERISERQAARNAAASAPRTLDKPARPARPPKVETVLDAPQLQHLQTLVQQAQSALDDGRVGELQQQLATIDAALGNANPASLSDELRTNLQALRAEGARLRSWQQWGGSRARDDLTDEAEALARQTQAAADPEAVDAPRLDIKTHREAIHALRLRWKELDRLGAPSNQPLWQRFDAALQMASVPVAAHHAALAATRQANLAEREALLAPLEALPLPGTTGHGEATRAGPPADLGGGTDSATATDPSSSALGDPDAEPDAGAHAPRAALDWKDLLRELAAFQVAWRKLGPLEHTVPAEARQRLQQRHRAAVDRIEAPLNEARRAAVAVREQLIAHAQALVPRDGQAQHRPLAEATRLVRNLQADWQDHARQLPLARPVENDLWTRFKAATDAVFAHRDAAFAARDAELTANLAAAEALLERLAALGLQTPRAEIERTLAEVDRGWRDGGELPRGALDGVERRFRGLRAAAVELLSAGERTRWQAQCDTLVAALALCEERESGTATEAAPDAALDAAPESATDFAQASEPGVTSGASDAGAVSVAPLATRWAALGTLPAPWYQPLAQRWARLVTGPGPLAGAAVDELLLQLEAALDLPTPPAWEPDRRQLKLRTLKEAMEGRRAEGAGGPAQQASWLQALLRQAGLSAAQHERLAALLAALRRGAPGALGSPVLPR